MPSSWNQNQISYMAMLMAMTESGREGFGLAEAGAAEQDNGNPAEAAVDPTTAELAALGVDYFQSDSTALIHAVRLSGGLQNTNYRSVEPRLAKSRPKLCLRGGSSRQRRFFLFVSPVLNSEWWHKLAVVVHSTLSHNSHLLRVPRYRHAARPNTGRPQQQGTRWWCGFRLQTPRNMGRIKRWCVPTTKLHTTQG